MTEKPSNGATSFSGSPALHLIPFSPPRQRRSLGRSPALHGVFRGGVPRGESFRLGDRPRFDGGDGQVGVVGDGKNHMEEFDMSAEDSRGLKGGRKLNQMGGRESKLNAKNAWGTTTGYADELAKRGMVEIDEYGEDKLARRRQQLENWRNQEELRMKKDHQMAKRGVGKFKLCFNLRCGSRDAVVAEFELTHSLIPHRPSSRRCRARSTATSTTAPTSSSSTTGRRTRCRRSRSRA
mgnify:CR=1 FL=1